MPVYVVVKLPWSVSSNHTQVYTQTQLMAIGGAGKIEHVHVNVLLIFP